MNNTPCAEIGGNGPANAKHIKPEMVIETTVFGAEHRKHQIVRHFIERYDGGITPATIGDLVAIPVKDRKRKRVGPQGPKQLTLRFGQRVEDQDAEQNTANKEEHAKGAPKEGTRSGAFLGQLLIFFVVSHGFGLSIGRTCAGMAQRGPRKFV